MRENHFVDCHLSLSNCGLLNVAVAGRIMTKSHLLNDYSKQFVITIYHFASVLCTLRLFLVSLFYFLCGSFLLRQKITTAKKSSVKAFCVDFISDERKHFSLLLCNKKKPENNYDVIHNTATWAYHSSEICIEGSALSTDRNCDTASIFHIQLKGKISVSSCYHVHVVYLSWSYLVM